MFYSIFKLVIVIFLNYIIIIKLLTIQSLQPNDIFVLSISQIKNYG